MSSSDNPIDFECNFEIHFYIPLGDVYRCNIKNNPNIVSYWRRTVGTISGRHSELKRNSNVAGFSAYDKTIHFFPIGLQKSFSNLKTLKFVNCHLKEIDQADLKPFPELVDLDLNRNDIEVLEADLFTYNRKLVLVWLSRNRISHVDPNVFDQLSQLNKLGLGENKCVKKDAFGDESDVTALIKIVKSTCYTKGEIPKLQAELKEMNSKHDRNKIFTFFLILTTSVMTFVFMLVFYCKETSQVDYDPESMEEVDKSG